MYFEVCFQESVIVVLFIGFFERGDDGNKLTTEQNVLK